MGRALASLLITSVAGCFLGCAGGASPTATDAKHESKIAYTAHSFYYEKGRYLTTNYRTGILLPINTKVKILSIGRKSIEIEVVKSGQVIDIVNAPKYTGLDIDGIYGRMFSAAPVDLSRFSARDRGLIRAGKVGVGMRRDAVIKALGYPPSHKTPTLEQRKWTYWRNRFRTFVVEFSNGKVVRIRE